MVEHDKNVMITFSNSETGELVGQLLEVNGILTFEGNADESARYFFNWICDAFKRRDEALREANNN